MFERIVHKVVSVGRQCRWRIPFALLVLVILFGGAALIRRLVPLGALIRATAERALMTMGSTARQVKPAKLTIGRPAPRLTAGALAACMLLTLIPAEVRAVDETPSLYAGASYWSDEGVRASSFAAGSGDGTSEAQAYLISTPNELGYLAYLLKNDPDHYKSKYYKLTGSINLSGHNWKPMSTGTAFFGTFDGGNFTITNMTVTINGGNEEDRFGGLFGKVYGGTIRNVTVGTGSTVTANYTGSTTESSYGAAAGYVYGSGTVENCHSQARIAVTFTNDSLYVYAGGIVGRLDSGTIKTCSNSGEISGTSIVAGGVAGRCGNTSGGNIRNCWNTGNLTIDGTGSYAGGIVGDNCASSSTIKNCYNTGRIEGKKDRSFYGGAAGSNSGVIENCYNAGTLTLPDSSQMSAGGLIGTNYGYDEGRVSNGYWRKDTGVNEALNAVGDSYGVQTDLLSFTDGGTFSGGTVMIDSVTYPQLLPALNAWVDHQSSDFWYWTGPSAAPILTKDPPPATYAVTVEVRKDGVSWPDHGKKFKLVGTGATAGTTAANLNSVENGTYDVYEEDADTGEKITVTDGPSSVTVDYYTVTFYDGDSSFITGDQQPQIIRKGSRASAPAAPVKSGFLFDKWMTASGSGVSFEFDTVPIVTTTAVYAGWIKDTSSEVEITWKVRPGPYYRNDSLIFNAEVTNKKTHAPVTAGHVQFYKGNLPLGGQVSYLSGGSGISEGFSLAVLCDTSDAFPSLPVGTHEVKAVYIPTAGSQVESASQTIVVSDRMNGNAYLGAVTAETTYNGSTAGACAVQFTINNSGTSTITGIGADQLTITGTKDGQPFDEFTVTHNPENTIAYVYVNKPGTYTFKANLDNGTYAGEEEATTTMRKAKLVIAPKDLLLPKNGIPTFSYTANGLKGEDRITGVTYSTTANGHYGTVGTYTISISAVTLDHGDCYSLETRTAQLTIEETYQVRIDVKKDGAAWNDHGRTFALQKDGETPVSPAAVTAGTYKVLDGGVDTGRTVTIENRDISVTLDYYTVSFSIVDAGQASGSGISAAYDGTAISSGGIRLGGRTLRITAAGRGADRYSYDWRGEGTSGAATNVLTLDRLDAKVDVVCTVTGSNGSGGSGHSGSHTTVSTSANPDGSRTTTVTNETTGTVTETTENSNGIKIVVQTQKDGEKSIEVAFPNGTAAPLVAAFPVEEGTVALLLSDGGEKVIPYSLVENGLIYVRLNGNSPLRIDLRQDFFDDLSGHWAEESADFMGARELFMGTASRTFSPEKPMTRAMLTTVLYRLDGAPETGPAPFPDVADDKWYTSGIAWAADQNIVFGLEDNRFHPDRAISRQELMMMLLNYTRSAGIDISTEEGPALSSYPDSSDADEWAVPALQWACGAGILRGDENGALNPTGLVTRGEAAAIIRQLITCVLK